MALLDTEQQHTYQQIIEKREREKEQRQKDGKGRH